MQHIILKVKDESKLNVLIQFLRNIDFIEIEEKIKKDKEKGNIFKHSFGIWKDREITLDQLREKVWKRIS